MATGIDLAGWLVARRLPIYLGGLAAIAGARSLAVPEPFATATVGLAMAAMVCTYLAERLVRTRRADRPTATRYTTGQRVGVAASLGGFAVGGFFALTDRLAIAAPFLLGSILLLNWVFPAGEGSS